MLNHNCILLITVGVLVKRNEIKFSRPFANTAAYWNVASSLVKYTLYNYYLSTDTDSCFQMFLKKYVFGYLIKKKNGIQVRE